MSGRIRAGTLLPALLLVQLAACGFHLRGEVALPEWLESAYVQGEARHGEVADELRRALRRAGAEVTARPDQARAVIRIEGEQSRRRILSVGSDGRPREYELSYSLSYSLHEPAGGALARTRTVTESRSYTFDEVDVLGKSTERDQLWRELRRRAVAALLTRLRYSRPQRAGE